MQFNVQGMTCAHCERAIQQAVAAIGGVARVNLAGGTVEVTGVDDAVAARHAIEAAGYTVAAAPVATVSAGCCGSRK